MHYLKDDNLEFFALLTAEEQLDDIRNYIYDNRANFGAPELMKLEKMLGMDTREKHALVNEIARMNNIFISGTASEVLNGHQLDLLAKQGNIVICVPARQVSVFAFWARTCGYLTRLVAEHKCSAYEYLIWKDNGEVYDEGNIGNDGE